MSGHFFTVMSSTSEKIAGAAAGISGGSAVAGMTVGQFNEYLQAGAFIVAIISGLCASWYYVFKKTP